MANFQLQINQNGQQQKLTLNPHQQTVITAQAHSQYQLLNEFGALIIEPQTQMVGQDLWVMAQGQAFLIIKNYQAMNPIHDLDTLMGLQATFATGQGQSLPMMPLEPIAAESTTALTAETVSVPVVQTPLTPHSTGMSSTAKIGVGALGLLAIGGIAAAAGGGGGNDDSKPTPPAPRIQFNPITDDNIINLKESQNTIQVSGSVQNAHAGDTLTLNIGNQTFSTTLQNNLQFSIAISGEVLKSHTQLSGSLNTVTDGQTLSATQTHAYRVDTEIAQPIITFNPITGDNLLTETELTGKITLSGSVQNAQQGDTVQLTLANQTYSATLNAQGQFSTAVDGSAFLNSTQVHASINTSDTAQNTASAQASITYQIDPNAFRPTLTLNAITGDNVLNTTETKGNVTVSGSITHVAQGEKVQLLLGNQTIEATVNNDGTFSTTVSGSLLAQHTQISAQYHHQGQLIAQSQSYTVLPDSVISLHHIDGDNVIDVAQLAAMSRISGSLNVNGMASKWRAQGVLREITLHIGDKAYTAALTNDHTFEVNIPTAELADLSGQSITYSLNHLENLNVLHNNGNQIYYIPINFTGSPSTDLRLLTLNSPDVVGKQGDYRVGDVVQTVTVAGSVDENGREGNVVNVVVNQQTYHTTVNANREFAIDVKLNDVLADKQITASLPNTNSSDNLTYEIKNSVSTGDFVSGNGTIATHDLPYFINVVNAVQNTIYSIGYLNNHITGTPRTIEYHFATQAELDDLTNTNLPTDDLARLNRHGLDYINGSRMINDLMLSSPEVYSTKHQAQVREALASISKSVNVKFVEVNSTLESDVDFYFNDTNMTSPNSAGYAYFGGDVYLNKTLFAKGFEHNDGMSTVVHETLHSLGLKHPHREEDDKDTVPVLSEAQDSSGVSIMSYAIDDYLATAEPHLYDLAFLHYYYGVNPEARAEDNIYTFKDFNRTVADGDIYIWDGGGVDTFTAANETQGVLVNLTAGSWIYADKNHANTDAFGLIGKYEMNADAYLSGSLYANTTDAYTYGYHFTDGVAFIGYGTQLENLVGSAYDDILTGNATGNVIHGGAGNDVIDGGGGSNFLTGGAGKDTFVFSRTPNGQEIDTISDFNPNEDLIGLKSSVFSNISNTMTDFERHVQYNASTGALSYDSNGTGKGVQFAALSPNLDLEQSHFVII